MEASKHLFDNHPDWLTHTLANSDIPLPELKTQLPDGTRAIRRAVGVLELCPPADRPNPNHEALIISAGVHGNETAPIEVLNGLVTELLNGQWTLACPVLLILGNPPAMVAGERFVDANMNRLFHGAHGKETYKGLPEATRAQFLEEACRQFATLHPHNLCHYDLHTAIRPSRREKFALYPFVAGREVPRAQCDFLLEAGVETLLLQHREDVFVVFVFGAEGGEFYGGAREGSAVWSERSSPVHRHWRCPASSHERTTAGSAPAASRSSGDLRSGA